MGVAIEVGGKVVGSAGAIIIPGGGTSNAQQDFANRVSGPQVVTYNGFASVNEVNLFRWGNGIGSGNDPNGVGDPNHWINWMPSGGPGGLPHMAMFRAAGLDDGESWWRPLSPLTGATNGRGSNDPAANGTIALQPWNVTQGGGELTGWQYGYYSLNPTIGASGPDGSDFWIQIRIKMDPNATGLGGDQMVSPSKLIEIGCASTGHTLTVQNLVTWMCGGVGPESSSGGQLNYHSVYIDGSAYSYNPDDGPGFRDFVDLAYGDPNYRGTNEDPDEWQIGGALSNYGTGDFCARTQPSTLYPNSGLQYCWSYSGGWDTLLYHVTPGSYNGSAPGLGPNGGALCQIQVYAAHQGETSYTKIWDMPYELSGWGLNDGVFDQGHAGYMSFYLQPYSNGAQGIPQPLPFTLRASQFILAKGDGTNNIPIPCPQDYTGAPAWFVNMPNQTWTQIAAGAGFGSAYQNGSTLDNVVSNVYGGQEGLVNAWNGGAVDQSLNELSIFASGGHGAYAGNEAYVCKIDAAVPGWIRLNTPTPNSQVVSPTAVNQNVQNLDGSPIPTHTYSHSVAANGFLWRHAAPAQGGGVFDSTVVFKFNRASLVGQSLPLSTAGPWTNLGLGVPTLAGGGNLVAGWLEGSSSIYERMNNNIWTMFVDGADGNGIGCYSTNATTGIHTQWPFSIQGTPVACSALAYGLRNANDPGIWAHLDYENGAFKFVDLNNPSGQTGGLSTLTLSGTLSVGEGAGMVYHPASRAFLLWDNSGANLQKVVVPVTSPVSGTYVASTVSPASGNTVIPSTAQGNGTFSRFNIIEDMGNGQSALVVFNDLSQPIYVYKLPVNGV